MNKCNRVERSVCNSLFLVWHPRGRTKEKQVCLEWRHTNFKQTAYQILIRKCSHYTCVFGTCQVLQVCIFRTCKVPQVCTFGTCKVLQVCVFGTCQFLRVCTFCSCHVLHICILDSYQVLQKYNTSARLVLQCLRAVRL